MKLKIYIEGVAAATQTIGFEYTQAGGTVSNSSLHPLIPAPPSSLELATDDIGLLVQSAEDFLVASLGASLPSGAKNQSLTEERDDARKQVIFTADRLKKATELAQKADAQSAGMATRSVVAYGILTDLQYVLKHVESGAVDPAMPVTLLERVEKFLNE